MPVARMGSKPTATRPWPFFRLPVFHASFSAQKKDRHPNRCKYAALHDEKGLEKMQETRLRNDS